MFKRILVPTDGSDAALVGVRYAIALAQRRGATLLGLYVVDVKLLEGPFLRDISASLGTAPFVNYQNNIAMLLDESGKAALHVFQDLCAAAGVPCETRLETGVVARTILENCALADLIIMGRGGAHNQWLNGLVGSTTEAIARRAPLPLLITGQDAPGFSRFLVAFDGSPHARQALKTATMIAGAWQMPFHLLTVGGTGQGTVLDDAKRYLQAHEIDVECILLDGEPGEVIAAYAGEYGADLLVMGAYGHSKVRELVMGSTTAYAINHAPCPVLLAR